MYKIYTDYVGGAVMFRSCKPWLLMFKLTVFFLTIGLLQVSAASFGQRITVRQQSAALEDIFSEITRQTGFRVLYDGALLDKSVRADVDVTNAPAVEVLQRFFPGRALSFVVRNKTLIISEREQALTQESVAELLAIREVRGRVTDSLGNPLYGATVQVRGFKISTQTDRNGEFILNYVPDDAVLVISFIGYITREVTAAEEVGVIILRAVTSTLEEVEVSTGYQTIPKERATGSFVQIANELLNRSVTTNVLDRLKGVVSGLNFEPRMAGRSNHSDINIRGINTITANMKPLIVVDGFPYEEGDGTRTNILLANLNPQDVASVTILRDAAAASIWGARAGNGVIVITTKKGRFDQPATLQFNSNITVAEKPDLYYIPAVPSADAVSYERTVFDAGYYNEYDDLYPQLNFFPNVSPAVGLLLANRRGALSNEELERQLNELAAHDVRHDISQYMLRPQLNQQYTLNIRGGSSLNSYYASAGYDHNRSSQVGDAFNRLTLRLDNTFRPFRNLEWNGYIVYTRSNSHNNSGGDTYNNYLPHTAAPYNRLADADGHPLHVVNAYTYRTDYLDTLSLPGLKDWHYRPLEEIRNNQLQSILGNIRIGTQLSYRLLSGLRAEARYQYESGRTDVRNVYNQQSYYTRDLINRFMYTNTAGQAVYPIPLGDILDNATRTQTIHNGRLMLALDRQHGHHQLSGIAGAEMRQTEHDFQRDALRYGFDPGMYTYAGQVDYITLYTLRPGNNGTGRIPVGSALDGSLNRFISYFANAGYTFKNRYTLTGSARSDGSNLFGVKANQRFSPLWSAGLLWNIGNEPAYRMTALPHVTLRATYGFSGNIRNDASALPTVTYRNLGTLTWVHRETDATLNTPPNPGLTWEKVRTFNLALEVATRGRRLQATLEYYSKKGIDLISSLAIDPTSGVDSYTANNASIRGRGLDFSLQAEPVRGPLTWYSNLLLSYNTDRVTAYTIEPTTGQLRQASGQSPYVGRPLFALYSYQWEGLDPETGNPQGYHPATESVSTNYGEIARDTRPEDLVYHGPAQPQYFGAFRNDLSWNRITLSVNLMYKLGYYFRRPSVSYSSLFSRWGGHGDYTRRWQQPGDEQFTDVPSAPTVQNSARDGFYLESAVLAERGDHLRVQDLRITYQLPLVVAGGGAGFKALSIYGYSNNLGIIWRRNNHGIDPDVGGTSIPQPRSYAIGIQATW